MKTQSDAFNLTFIGFDGKPIKYWDFIWNKDPASDKNNKSFECDGCFPCKNLYQVNRIRGPKYFLVSPWNNSKKFENIEFFVVENMWRFDEFNVPIIIGLSAYVFFSIF